MSHKRRERFSAPSTQTIGPPALNTADAASNAAWQSTHMRIFTRTFRLPVSVASPSPLRRMRAPRAFFSAWHARAARFASSPVIVRPDD